MKMSSTIAKLLVFVVVTTMAGVFVAFTAGNIRFGPSRTYSAEFTSATGVTSGSEVRIAGVPVGSVSRVRLDGNERAVVEFDVSERNTLMSGTRAMIRYKNLIGDRFIELLPGPGPMDTLPEGAMIPASRTAPALDMDQVVNGFRPLLQGLEPAAANRITGSLIEVLNGREAAISSLVENIGSLSNTIADRDQTVGQIITNMNSVLKVVNDRAGRFDELIGGLSTLVERLSDDRDMISDSLVKTDGLTRAMGEIVTDAEPALHDSVVGLNRLTSNLQRDTSTLDLVLNRLPETYRLVGRGSGYGNFVNFFVCGLAIKYGPNAHDRTPIFTAPATRCKP